MLTRAGPAGGLTLFQYHVALWLSFRDIGGASGSARRGTADVSSTGAFGRLACAHHVVVGSAVAMHLDKFGVVADHDHVE